METPLNSNKDSLREAARLECEVAWRNMNNDGDASKAPISDPARLEYYLFEYDARYVREDKFKWAIKRRNQYLRSEGLPVPYEDSILDAKYNGTPSNNAR